MKWIALISLSTAIGTGILMWQDDLVPLLRIGPLKAAPQRRSTRPPRRTIFAAGVTEGAQREIELGFEIDGRLASVAVTEGRHVQKDDILARLDDALLQHRLAQAKSDLDLAQAERERLVNGASSEARRLARTEAQLAAARVEQAQADYRRTSEAYKRKSVNAQQVDDAYYAWKIARAQYERAKARVAEVEAKARSDELKMADARIRLARAKVDQARSMLDKTLLRAPVDGVVVKVEAEPGELVAVERPVPVIKLVDDSRLRVRAFVEELDALKLRRGERAWVVADGQPDVRHPGTVEWIAPSMQPKTQRHNKPGERIDTRVREVIVHLDDPGKLVIGLPVDVYIDPAADEDAESADDPPPRDQTRVPRSSIPSDQQPGRSG